MKTIINKPYVAIKQLTLQHRYVLAMVGCMVVHAILCLYQIGRADYWLDEFASLDSVRHSFGYILFNSFAEHNQPPLYFVILWIWHRLFGDGEATLRLLSTIFSVATIPIVATIGTVAFNKKVGIIAALLTACSYFVVIYAQEVRAYSMLLFMSTLSMLCFIFLMKEYMQSKQASGVTLWGYIIVAIANLYIHPFAIFVQGAHFIIALMVMMAHKLPIRYVIRAGVVMGIATIPVIFGYIFKSYATESLLNNTWWVSQPGLGGVVRSLLFSRMPDGIRKVLYECLCIGLVGLAFVRAFYIFRTDKQKLYKTHWVELLCVATLFTVVVLPFLSSVVFTPFFVTRYTISAVVALYLLLARAVTKLPWHIIQVWVVMLLATTLIWTTDTLWSEQGYKPQFRMAIQHVIDNSNSGDIVILDSEQVARFQTLNSVEHYIKRNSEFGDDLSSNLLKVRESSITTITDRLFNNNGWYIASNHRGYSAPQIPNLNEILSNITCTVEESQYHRVMLLYLSNCRPKN